MKKVLIIALMLFCGTANAQNYLSMNITEIQEQQIIELCVNDYDSIVFTKEAGCSNQAIWNVRDFHTQQVIQQGYDVLTLIPSSAIQLDITYISQGCNITHRVFNVIFHDFNVNNPWSESYIWKRTGTNITLSATWGDNLYYQWSTGATYQEIAITEPGTYWVRIYNDCGELYDTIQVRDNVEIDLATCDLVTNLNMVTWQTTPAQAQYIDHVIVKRDGLNVGTANYSDGFFLDNIGSDLAQRTYTLTAVATDGTECPIVSYPKETIHMAYLTGVNNTIEVNWNTPTGYDLLGYNICEWTPGSKDGDLTVIDFVGASVNSYTCSASLFENGYIVVQGVENSKSEERLLSNRSEETLSIDEQQNKIFKIYPNPSNGMFTVEGNGRLSVRNVLGQEIMTKEIEGSINIELSKGIYFLKMNGRTQKVVVE